MYVVFSIFMLLVVIIIMNMLIAVMGDTYDRVSGQMQGMLQCQKAELIAEAELFYAGPYQRDNPLLFKWWPLMKCVLALFLIPVCPSSPFLRQALKRILPAGGDFQVMFPKFLHVLRIERGGETGDGDEEWEGRLKAMQMVRVLRAPVARMIIDGD